jgi:hypothetical protein
MWLAAFNERGPFMSARRSGRKRAAPITLPSIASLPAVERPRVARARLNAVASPLAYDVTGEHGEVTIRPKQPERPSPDDQLTPERRRHALDAGLLPVVDSYRTEAGERTQLKRQRIVSPLDRLWKAGIIDADQYAAARRFQRDCDMAAVSGPGMSVAYALRMIQSGGQRFLLPMEAQADHQRRVVAAQQACGDRLARMLAWIAIEPMSWRQQARAWWPDASERAARVAFKRQLRLCCSALEAHYRRR